MVGCALYTHSCSENVVVVGGSSDVVEVGGVGDEVTIEEGVKDLQQRMEDE